MITSLSAITTANLYTGRFVRTRLSLFKGLLFSAGQGVSDRFMAFTGVLTDINAAVGLLTYDSDEGFNSGQHVEVLTVAIQQMASTETKVRYLNNRSKPWTWLLSMS